MRKKAASLFKGKQIIEWRSHEPSRLETFSDAVFAFAVTLIIVSLEVPKSFTELFETMKGTLSFAACFGALFQIWNQQNIFFRRYGLHNSATNTLNGALLFVVLLYVYPLKFLFSLLFDNNSFVESGHAHEMISTAQMPTLMLIYGSGFTAINLLFCLMYLTAKKHAKELKLKPVEMFETQTVIYVNLTLTLIGVTAMLLAWLLPVEYSGMSGFTYMLIGLAYWIWYSYRGKMARKKFGPVTDPAS
ncbi:TMEM175 family protein [Mucilaginibacter sp.]|uniref:TMEM175 family protein n=1 Tax=Mucilaginibacter sp. TaxID=1882438 RepID=UPI002844C1E3|nr:TMEM175 family protein [Mucilaginibacter sp.]MDR3694732.1 TMEM175 family protein [Mucilaginibacter sp.]